MHEAAITRSLISTVMGECERRELKRVTRVDVEVGFATTFVKEPLEYYFDFFKKEHAALSEATLRVTMLPGNQINLKSIEVDE